MSVIKNIIKDLVEKGKIQEEVTVQGTKFVLETISSEEQFLVESMTSITALKEKYKAEAELSSFVDTLTKMRNVSLLAYHIKTMDGHVVVDSSLSAEEQFKKRLEFREDLSKLPGAFIDALLVGYNKLYEKNKELYKDVKGTLGK